MDNKDKLLEIIETRNQQAIAPFLQSLTEKDRKSLVPTIQEGIKEYYTWESRQIEGAWDKVKILNTASFVCLTTAKERRGLTPWDIPETEEMEKILEWYCPPWFSDMVNTARFFRDRTYERVVYWNSRGWVNPLSIERIMETLPSAVIHEDCKAHKRTYTLQILEENPIALDEHIWYLFEYPSNIDWVDKSSVDNKDKKSTKGNWCDTFIHYASTGRINRMRVLRESLQAVNRNFNKTQTGWFSSLFVAMEPTTEELISLQDELFASLSCVQSKPVNTTLGYFKKLCTNPDFNISGLLPCLPLLLGSEVKSIVATTLLIIETILKKQPELSGEICPAVCTSFFSKDESIQKKAAEIIVKFAQPGAEMNDAISQYSGNILMSVRHLLQAYLDITEENNVHQQKTADDITPIAPASLISKKNKIPEITSFEDFAFSLSIWLDATETHHFDLLLDGLATWGNQADEKTLVLLEPVFQKAYKLIVNRRWREIPLRAMPFNLIVSYHEYLLKKYPGKLERLKAIREKAITLDKEWAARFKPNYQKKFVTISKLNVPEHFIGFRQVAICAFEKMKNKDLLPLVSTPTHLPGWIDPVVLVTRLMAYSQADHLPDDMDMQLAIQRCALENTKEALQLAKQNLTGELKELMLFLLDKNSLPKSKYEHPSWWMTAGITRSPEIRFSEFKKFEYNQIPEEYLYGNHQWEAYLKEYLAYGTYNREKREYERFPATTPNLRLCTPEYKATNAKPLLFLEYYLRENTSEAIELMLLATPNLPDNIYGRTAVYLSNCCSSCAWEVSEQKTAFSAVKILHELNTPFRDMHYLFLAVCMLAGMKSVKDYAAQIWMERVSQGTIDSNRIGDAIGKMEALEVSPLKRFTDLMSSNMTGISKQHNKAAQEIIEAILPHLNGKSVKNLKKLQEIYNELQALNN